MFSTLFWLFAAMVIGSMVMPPAAGAVRRAPAPLPSWNAGEYDVGSWAPQSWTSEWSPNSAKWGGSSSERSDVPTSTAWAGDSSWGSEPTSSWNEAAFSNPGSSAPSWNNWEPSQKWSSAQAAISAAPEQSPSPADGTFSGDITYYSPGMGSCGVVNFDSDFVVALNAPQMSAGDSGNSNNNPLCGKWVTITYGGKTAQAIIEDTCS
jgi:hypothetical protein